MNVCTNFEDLSNEIFFDIFDYLNAFDVFTGFTFLNGRISSILKSIPLRIVILENNFRSQVDFLSSHLIFHEQQVISIQVSDTICDDSRIISLLFNRHNFMNVKSCKFYSTDLMTKLDNVTRQIKSFNKLVLFHFYNQYSDKLNVHDKSELTRTLLMHRSLYLRSIRLYYSYDYLDLSNSSAINSNLTSINLRISDLSSTVSLYSVLLILRLCYGIRFLGLIVDHTNRSQSVNTNVPSEALTMNKNGFPILSQVKSLELSIASLCDSYFIPAILRCMPNLMYFYFNLSVYKPARLFLEELLDGYIWERIFKHYLPCLSKFEFRMLITKRRSPRLDLDIILNSFEYLTTKYINWHVIIDRWRRFPRCQGEFVMLRTMNCDKHKSNISLYIPCIYSESFETRSTSKITDNHYSFCSNIKDLQICMSNKRPNINWSSSLFQHITCLLLEMPMIHVSWWENLINVVHFRQNIDKNNDAEENVTYLSHFVHLPNLIEIEFGSTLHVCRWKYAQCILEACPNVINLIINTPLLVSSSFIDNLSLNSIFKKIKMIKSITKKIYFPSDFALKLVQRFPSLGHIELQVFSFDHCVFIIDVFLSRLEHLSYLKISYNQDTLLDNPFSRQSILTKRCQTFPKNIIDEQKINVKNNGEVIQIWLS